VSGGNRRKKKEFQDAQPQVQDKNSPQVSEHVLVHEGVAAGAETAPAEPAGAEERGGLDGRVVGRVAAEPRFCRRRAGAVRRDPVLLRCGGAAAERGQPVLLVLPTATAAAAAVVGQLGLLVVLLHHRRERELRHARGPAHRVLAVPLPLPHHISFTASSKQRNKRTYDKKTELTQGCGAVVMLRRSQEEAPAMEMQARALFSPCVSLVPACGVEDRTGERRREVVGELCAVRVRDGEGRAGDKRRGGTIPAVGCVPVVRQIHVSAGPPPRPWVLGVAFVILFSGGLARSLRFCSLRGARSGICRRC
jgi:hypothetical protein